MSVVYMWDGIFSMGLFYAGTQTLLCANYARTVFNFMSNAVTKIVLLEGGKKVEFTFGRTGGATKTFDIKDIKK